MVEQRIKRFIEEQNLTSSQLAAKLQIQKSGISHILLKRNKPSYDFFLKLKTAFPEVDLNYLITGEKTKINPPEEIQNSPNLFAEEKVNTENNEETHFLPPKSFPDASTYSKASSKIKTTLEKVLFIYSDGSFKELKKNDGETS